MFLTFMRKQRLKSIEFIRKQMYVCRTIYPFKCIIYRNLCLGIARQGHVHEVIVQIITFCDGGIVGIHSANQSQSDNDRS